MFSVVKQDKLCATDMPGKSCGFAQYGFICPPLMLGYNSITNENITDKMQYFVKCPRQGHLG